MDITGSTAITQRHDPEVVRGALSRVFAELSTIIRTHGGTVEKFIGDAVMAVFGVPIAHDDDADRAVRAALECRARVRLLNADVLIPIELRIGVNSGEVVADTSRVDQFLVTGAPVNAASRLQAAADPGEILAGETTRRLARDAAFGAPRVIDARGIGQIRAFAVSEDAVARPSSRGVFVGRTAEIDALRRVLASVIAERRAWLAVVYGQAGVGKSRLVDEFTKALIDVNVLRGRCLPYGESMTLHPLRQIFRSDAGIEPTDERADALAKLDRRIKQLISPSPHVALVIARIAVLLGLALPDDALPSVAVPTIAEELRWGATRYIESLAKAGPTVLVFEDVHWAEAPLLEFIKSLTTLDVPLLVVALARTELRDESASWSGTSRLTTIDVGPLDTVDVATLVTALAVEHPLGNALRDHLVSRAEGNPLYVEEFVLMLAETGDELGDDIPVTLRSLLTARLDRLRPDLKVSLGRASVVGRVFSAASLQALGVLDARDQIAEAVRRDVVMSSDERVPGGGEVFKFKHALIRDVMYATIPKSERAAAHDAYGRWLERTAGDRQDEIAEVLAHHAEHAFLLTRELQLPDADRLGVRALGLLNEAAIRARQSQDHGATRLYDHAATIASMCPVDDAMRAEAIAGAAVSHYWLRGDRAELDSATHLYDGLPNTDTSVAVLLARCFAAMADGTPDVYMPLEERAVAAARETGDPNIIAEALGVRANGAYQSGDPRRYVDLVDEAIAYARQNSAVRELPRLLMLRHIMATRQAEFTLALALEDEIARTRTASGLATVEVAWLARRSALRHAMGRKEEALPLAERAVELARAHASKTSLGVQLWHLGSAWYGLGVHVEARDAFAEATGLFVALGQRGQIPEVAARCARARLRLGDLAGAARDVDLASANLLQPDLESRSITAIAKGELYAARNDIPEADAAFCEAIDLLARSPYVIYQARARLAYAEYLIGRGRHADAQTQLLAARQSYSDPAAARRRAQIDSLLALTETSVPRP